jgi:hypothetical protein
MFRRVAVRDRICETSDPIGPPYSVGYNKRYSDGKVARLDPLDTSRRHILRSCTADPETFAIVDAVCWAGR